MPIQLDLETFGKQYGRPDIERLGVFIEMPYLNGKGYVTPFPKNYPAKGKNIIGEGRKSKCGTQHGYFDEEFRRLFEGEGIVRPKGRNKKVKPLTPFMPAGYPKWHSTPGDYYGCFSGNIEAFGNLKKPKPKYKREPANFLTSPVKLGGPGYTDICLSKYPEHLPEPYHAKVKITKKDRKKAAELFPMITVHCPQPFFDINPYVDPNGKIGPTYVHPKKGKMVKYLPFIPIGPAKWQGGCHAGTFEPFPEWKTDRTIPKKKKVVTGTTFYPQSMAMKTKQTFSIVNENTDVRVNCQNYHSFEPNYTNHLLD